MKQSVTINPSIALLEGTVDKKISQVVTVVADTKEPLQILHVDTLNRDDFRYSMAETEIDGKRAYQFLIENTKTSAGQYSDEIFIFTDNMALNPVTIIVRGDIKEIGFQKGDKGAHKRSHSHSAGRQTEKI